MPQGGDHDVAEILADAMPRLEGLGQRRVDIGRLGVVAHVLAECGVERQRRLEDRAR